MSAMQRRVLRRRSAGMSSNQNGASPSSSNADLILPGGFRLPANLMRRKPFVWLLKLFSLANQRNLGSVHISMGKHRSSGSHSSKSSHANSLNATNDSCRTSFSLTFIIGCIIILGIAMSVVLYQYQTYAKIRMAYTSYSAYYQNSLFSSSHQKSSSGGAVDFLTKRMITNFDEDQSELFWGTYRPQAYFGIKHRSSHSLLAGLAWFDQRDGSPKIRLDCKREDEIVYNWLQHDGRYFGDQEIQEKDFTLSTIFLKRVPPGSRGGDWTSRIVFNPKSRQAKSPLGDVVVSLIFFVTIPDNQRGSLTSVVKNGILKEIRGFSLELGSFSIHFQSSSLNASTRIHHSSHVQTRLLREDKILETLKMSLGSTASSNSANSRFFRLIDRQVDGSGSDFSGNFLAFEVTVSSGDYSLNVIFQSQSTAGQDSLPPLLEGGLFESLLSGRRAAFVDRFDRVFPISWSGLPDDLPQLAGLERRRLHQLSHSVLANLLGGIGYFHGHMLVRVHSSTSSSSSPDTSVHEYGPFSLFTGTPSRQMFPRGFLWDEGFHQLLVARWDPEITVEVLRHWLETINAEGWIGREQVLGWEARAAVPDQFLVQDHRAANPPTLVLPLLLLMAEKSPEWMRSHQALLQQMLPRLEAWFHWFNTTQLSSFGASFGYRWHGRDAANPHQLNPLTLTSGLDDYPRSSHPTDDERHVDLMCWMALFSQAVHRLQLAVHPSSSSFSSNYGDWAATLRRDDVLAASHWAADLGSFADWGLHAEGAKLLRPEVAGRGAAEHQMQRQPAEKVRVVGRPRYQFVPHFGYVSVFPLLTRLLDCNSDKLTALLDHLSKDQLLWSGHGLRSLARSSSLYQRYNTEHDPPYWRGAIWLNMNALAVTALRHYANQSECVNAALAGKLHADLRAKLIGTVMGQFARTGFLWEQYDDNTGLGQRGRPFSGWSSLILLVLSEHDVALPTFDQPSTS